MNRNRELIDGMRAVADFLESKPELPHISFSQVLNIFVETKEELVGVARMVGGELEKKVITNYFFLRRNFGAFCLDINCERDAVCERVVVDKIEHPETVQPAWTEEIVEWRCPEAVLIGTER